MDTKQLKYFIAVCQSGSITGAAESIFVSQQALSASIARLEKELHATFFVRSSKGVEPTKAGLYLLSEAKRVLSIEDEIMTYLSSFHAMPVNLRVGCAYGVVHELSEKLLNASELSARRIRPKFIEYTDVKCEKAVENGEVDLGFAIGPVDMNKFQTRFLMSRKYCFVIHEAHPFAGQDKLKLMQLKDENLIMLNEQFKANLLFSDLCEQSGFTPEYVFEAGEIAPIQNLVLKQYGIGLSTDFISAKYKQPELKILKLDDVDYSWNVYLIWKKDKVLSEKEKDFVGYLLS